MHKMIGILDIIFKSFIPSMTAEEMKSKCLVSPFIMHPIDIIAS